MTGAVPESEALHARARAFVDAFERGTAMPEPFDVLAVDLARFQAAHVEGYARLLAARGVNVQALRRASDAPAVPTDAFKLARVATFDPSLAAVVFRTSGTTLGARGSHEMRTTATYDAAALALGRWALAVAGQSPASVLVLAPSAEEAPDSSLSHMFALFARAFGGGEAAGPSPFFVKAGDLRADELRVRIGALAPARPALVLGTSFAFVHLLEALNDAELPLPPGSRVVHTGGFKGRAREVEPDALRAAVARAFAVDPRAVVAEYGMTELSSQFYEATLVDASAGHGTFVEPPWARVVPLDPETLAPVEEGETGIARIEDLMNVDSAFAVLAADRVRRVEGGFELLGRAPGAPPRGCSIALDELLGREGS
jgi:Acyl-protein synthetase, LuxE